MEELIKRLERVIQTGAPDKDGQHPISAETVLEVVKGLSEHGTNLASLGTDCISRQQAIDAIEAEKIKHGNYLTSSYVGYEMAEKVVKQLSPIQPEITHEQAVEYLQSTGWMQEHDRQMMLDGVHRLTAQPEIVRCKDCIYYDPPHVENNGVRYEYDEMPAGAFDALGTGLVNAEYGINIGGRCCVDYYCKNYSDDKRVFVREDNYCGRAERRTDE